MYTAKASVHGHVLVTRTDQALDFSQGHAVLDLTKIGFVEDARVPEAAATVRSGLNGSGEALSSDPNLTALLRLVVTLAETFQEGSTKSKTSQLNHTEDMGAATIRR